MKIPTGWHIQYNPKPIPLRGHDWDYWHDEVDNDSRLTGTAGSEEEAKLAIMEKQAERYDFDKYADTPDDDDMHINIESLQYIIADMQRDLMERDKRITALLARAEAAEAIVEVVRQAYGIGDKAFNQSVLMTCIENSIRRSACLSRIENYLSVIEEYEDGEKYEVSLLKGIIYLNPLTNPRESTTI